MTQNTERAEFEAWANKDFYDGAVNIGEDWSEDRGMYKTASHHMAFHAFKAARRAPAAQVPQGFLPVASKSRGAWDGIEDAMDLPDGTDLYTAAQVQAMLAQGLAPGWQAVPVEPTIAMLIAGDMPRISTEQTTKNHAAYAAMLAAAPQPPEARKPLTDEQVRFGGRWLCLLCKSSTPGKHGLLDDRQTPCPEGARASQESPHDHAQPPSR